MTQNSISIPSCAQTPKNPRKMSKTPPYSGLGAKPFLGPPAKADIATAILTNVIEHLVLLLPPNKHAFTAKAVWADFLFLGDPATKRNWACGMPQKPARLVESDPAQLQLSANRLQKREPPHCDGEKFDGHPDIHENHGVLQLDLKFRSHALLGRPLNRPQQRPNQFSNSNTESLRVSAAFCIAVQE